MGRGITPGREPGSGPDRRGPNRRTPLSLAPLASPSAYLEQELSNEASALVAIMIEAFSAASNRSPRGTPPTEDECLKACSTFSLLAAQLAFCGQVKAAEDVQSRLQKMSTPYPPIQDLVRCATGALIALGSACRAHVHGQTQKEDECLRSLSDQWLAMSRITGVDDALKFELCMQYEAAIRFVDHIFEHRGSYPQLGARFLKLANYFSSLAYADGVEDSSSLAQPLPNIDELLNAGAHSFIVAAATYGSLPDVLTNTLRLRNAWQPSEYFADLYLDLAEVALSQGHPRELRELLKLATESIQSFSQTPRAAARRNQVLQMYYLSGDHLSAYRALAALCEESKNLSKDTSTEIIEAVRICRDYRASQSFDFQAIPENLRHKAVVTAASYALGTGQIALSRALIEAYLTTARDEGLFAMSEDRLDLWQEQIMELLSLSSLIELDPDFVSEQLHSGFLDQNDRCRLYVLLARGAWQRGTLSETRQWLDRFDDESATNFSAAPIWPTLFAAELRGVLGEPNRVQLALQLLKEEREIDEFDSALAQDWNFDAITKCYELAIKFLSVDQLPFWRSKLEECLMLDDPHELPPLDDPISKLSTLVGTVFDRLNRRKFQPEHSPFHLYSQAELSRVAVHPCFWLRD